MHEPMTAQELQAFLQTQYPIENEGVEWKEWRSLKHHVSAHAGDDVISYVSAMANMEGGALVLGVEDKTLQITGITDTHTYTPESLKYQLTQLCSDLPSEGLSVLAFITADTQARIWVIQIPKHAPRRPVRAKGKAWQRVGDSLVELRPERLETILYESFGNQDWSAVVVPQASMADLDPQALAVARQKFAARNTTKPWAHDIAGWSDAIFLDKARVSVNGQLTHTALLLLGNPESTHLLSPHVAEVSWKLPDERAVEHFGPPFLLSTTEVLKRIRNPNIKLFPKTRLLAEEMPKYDTRVILEALHNCVAHQDYERCARIIVEEYRGNVVFKSAGGFFDGQPEQYLAGARMPGHYRNKFLANAMVALDMIDTAGFGIAEMFNKQRRRFLPLPDYEESDGNSVVLKIYGQAIDENYTQLLMERSDLPLEQVVWLDRVQKKLKTDTAHISELRKANLIEGRKPNYFVSAKVAAATNTQNQYVLNKGFDDDHYKRTILNRLKLGPATGDQLRQLVIDKLPAVLSAKEKETKVKNLRTALRLRGLDGVYIEVAPAGPARGAGAVWRIKAQQLFSVRSNEAC
jgi:ATP-dependent DNA helicase RecG